MWSTPVYQAETSVSELPVVMITGTVVGNLDDIMYGFVSSTSEQMYVKLSYAYDEIPGRCALSTLVHPTVDDPFHSVAIKWVETQIPSALRPLVKPRDFIHMNTTGIERLRNGERVGYHIFHSVQFPETPPLLTHIRGNTSISILHRQRTKNVLDDYIKLL
ncbi:unnamed protein product [Peronospora belbahrii]|uniref:START domain-containing protein n=1 Tax=Peronospora belbahrii TaxID=622444 RepID=A0AAU9KWU0_9STRA|nr:unnamed protein product [Peronospora belbahrii]CAH0513904.1 unnamed protein product [Peronospora belbahrii]